MTGAEVEGREPWWPSFRTSTSRLWPVAIISFSEPVSAAPVNRKDDGPQSMRTTSELSLMLLPRRDGARKANVTPPRLNVSPTFPAFLVGLDAALAAPPAGG